MYLSHHGILGQHWGKRNGPPYPLSPGSHSASEKKAGWKKSLDSNSKEEKHKLSDEELQRRRKIAKRIIKGVVVTGSLAGAAYLLYKTDAVDEIASNVKDYYDRNGKKLTEAQFRQQAQNACQKTVDEISKTVANLQSNGDNYILKEGSTVHHINDDRNFKIDKDGKKLYVSFKDRDVDAYKTVLDLNNKDLSQRYDASLKAIKDIVIPNEERTKQIVSEIINKPEFKDKLIDSLTTQKMYGYGMKNPALPDYKKLFELHRKDTVKEFDDFSEKQKIENVIGAIVTGNEAGNHVINTFKERGYNAILDFHDMGWVSEMPLILFDPSSSVIVSGNKFVSDNDLLKSAQALLNEPNHPMTKKDKDRGYLERLVKNKGSIRRTLK